MIDTSPLLILVITFSHHILSATEVSFRFVELEPEWSIEDNVSTTSYPNGVVPPKSWTTSSSRAPAGSSSGSKAGVSPLLYQKKK
jgi:hypothetical protein